MRYSNDPSGLKRSLAAARAEIERLTKERDSYFNAGTREMKRAAEALTRAEKAEAERDQDLAREAAAFEAAVGVLERHRDYGMIGSDGDYLAGEAEVLAHGNSLHYALCDVSALTPADAKAALSRMLAEARKEGMKRAADIGWVMAERDDIRGAILAEMEALK